jgi:hypothetical protein
MSLRDMEVTEIIGKVVYWTFVGPFIGAAIASIWPFLLTTWSSMFMEEDEPGAWTTFAVIAGTVLTVVWWCCLIRWGVAPVWRWAQDR